MNDSFNAITIQIPNGPEVLVRTWADGHVDVDVRTQRSKFGPRVWTPLGLLGGSFTVQEQLPL